LHREVIITHHALLARRHVELAIYMLCLERERTICFFLDEFDELYRRLPVSALTNLRALRDAHKYRLCYVLMLREHPARLRPPDQCEGFYELFSRSVLGLRPYSNRDAKRVVAQIAARRGRALPASDAARLLDLSGGHPGLILALFDAMINLDADVGRDWLAWGLSQPAIREECRKLWAGLAEDERQALLRIAQHGAVDAEIRELLQCKGLVEASNASGLFSPLFGHFVLTQGTLADQTLRVYDETREVWIGEKQIKDLTAREFDLLAYLARHAGLVCTRGQISTHLYPGESEQNTNVKDGRVDTLVKRVRKKVEPIREQPRYILTVRGKGYKLAGDQQ
jgi:hypothetical protein